MKFIITICAIALCLFLNQCSKCHTCTLNCITVHVQDPNNGGAMIYSSTICGNTSTISSWESGLNTSYGSQGYDVNFSNAAPQTQKTCGSTSQTNAAIASYQAAGYTCN
jgi:hypothetical protein